VLLINVSRLERSSMLTTLLITALIGLIAGALAKAIMPGRDPGGLVVTMLLGIAGAFVGTFFGRLLGVYGPESSAGFLASVIGAIVLLFAYRQLRATRV